MIESTTMKVKAVYSPKTRTFMGIEIELPLETYFISEDQVFWDGIRLGPFPPSSSYNSTWTKEILIGDLP